MKAIYKKDSIKNWPVEDRPRERLFRIGEHNLTDSELLAILLSSGTKGQSAIEVSRKILSKFKTFRNLSHIDSREWRGFKGLGKAKIARIKAALEIGRRFREIEKRIKNSQIKSSKDVVEMFMPRMRDLKKEVFKVLFLDVKNRIITQYEVTEGTPSFAHPIIRNIVSLAIQYFASGIICLHNHPSGDSNPSKEDKEFTERLKNILGVMEINLIDHIIFGDNNYFSFTEKGLS